MMEQEHLIELKNVSKEFDGTTVLSDIDLYIRKKEFLTLLGPRAAAKPPPCGSSAGLNTPPRAPCFLRARTSPPCRPISAG